MFDQMKRMSASLRGTPGVGNGFGGLVLYTSNGLAKPIQAILDTTTSFEDPNGAFNGAAGQSVASSETTLIVDAVDVPAPNTDSFDGDRVFYDGLNYKVVGNASDAAGLRPDPDGTWTLILERIGG